MTKYTIKFVCGLIVTYDTYLTAKITEDDFVALFDRGCPIHGGKCKPFVKYYNVEN